MATPFYVEQFKDIRITEEAVLTVWNSTSWSHLVLILAGIDTFSREGANALTPDKEDRSMAADAVKVALTCVMDVTRRVAPDAKFPATRSEFFKKMALGIDRYIASADIGQEVWLARHWVMASRVLDAYDRDPNKVLLEELKKAQLESGIGPRAVPPGFAPADASQRPANG